MSQGQHGHGATLSIGGTTIANIISITGPNQTRDAIDFSTMDSTSKFREFLPGMLDAGEATFELNYDGSAGGTANDLNTIMTNPAAECIITFPDTSDITVSGFATALSFGDPFDDKVTQSLTLKFTGVPVFTDVAA